MEIVVGKKSGFCYGVNNAIENANKYLSKSKDTVYCLGEIVHNQIVIDDLEAKGLKFIEDIKETKGKTIIRAHGIKKEIYEEAQEKGIELIDFTCPNVLKIHNKAQEYAKKGYYIILVGKKNHPETVGTISFCGENSSILSTIEEVEDVISKVKKSNFKKILILSQTTYSLKLFETIIKKIKEIISDDLELEIKNTICLATEERQKETEEIARKVDCMIVVGDKKSSNTTKLYEIACENCKNVIFTEDKKGINQEQLLQFKKIGIVAGASTPQEAINDIVHTLQEKKGEKN